MGIGRVKLFIFLLLLFIAQPMKKLFSFTIFSPSIIPHFLVLLWPFAMNAGERMDGWVEVARCNFSWIFLKEYDPMSYRCVIFTHAQHFSLKATFFQNGGGCPMMTSSFFEVMFDSWRWLQFFLGIFFWRNSFRQNTSIEPSPLVNCHLLEKSHRMQRWKIKATQNQKQALIRSELQIGRMEKTKTISLINIPGVVIFFVVVAARGCLPWDISAVSWWEIRREIIAYSLIKCFAGEPKRNDPSFISHGRQVTIANTKRCRHARQSVRKNRKEIPSMINEEVTKFS